LLVASIALGCGDAAGGAGTAAGCPQTLDRGRLESCLRSELGVPEGAQRVAILGQSSHLDWDWLFTFEAYFQRSVNAIFTDALELVGAPADGKSAAVYSIAEVAYVQRFVAEHPEAAAEIVDAGRRFRFLGGGITSPDNLLPEGEAFVRNFLVGRRWTDAQGFLTTPQAWLPDDFGHDAQLPITLHALGLDAVGFSRVPGVDTLRTSLRIDPPKPGSLADELLHDGVDFTWRAADGSEVLGHWLSQGYGWVADALDVPPPGAPDAPESETAKQHLRAIFSTLLPASHTPYAFVPLGSDFQPPKQNLVADVAAWNATEYPATGTFVVVGSFDDYARLVSLHREELPTRRFDPTPYWTGHIASRPELKILHVAATRALLAAEAFGVIANGALRDDPGTFEARAQERQQALAKAWETLVPSTHHDFVNGTSTDGVASGEQIPLLNEALALAEAQRDTALDEIAAAVPRSAGSAETLVVANPLGFARRGLVEIDLPAGDPVATGADGASRQRAADGKLLLLADAPSLGYVSLDPGASPEAQLAPATPSAPAAVEVSADGGTIDLENAALHAEIRRDSGWGLVSLVDRATGRELVAPDSVANDIVVYDDQGGLYRFGDEMAGCGLTPHPRAASLGAIPEQVDVVETGPLRVVVRTRVQLEGMDVVRTYSLVADEALLRLEASGAAASGTSVMVHMPLAGPVDEIVHGTPTHWDSKPAERNGPGLTFDAVHDFAIARSGGEARGAVLRAGVSAWAAMRDGLLVGVLWRNAPFERCDAYGPHGTDPDPHVVDYALRVPAGIGSPESGTALRDSLAFANPLRARLAGGGGTLPPSLSLASVDPLPAILTAAKPAEGDRYGIALRITQPSNADLPVHVETTLPSLVPHGDSFAPRLATALESSVPADEAAAARLRGDGGRFDLVARRAVSTVVLSPRD
jgi:alpha-mannosidase